MSRREVGGVDSFEVRTAFAHRAVVRVALLGLIACLSTAPVLTVAPRSDGVLWLFLVDDLHIDFYTTGPVRSWLVAFAKDVIRDEDAFAARATGPSSLSVGLLAGTADLERGFRSINGSAIKFEEIRKEPQGAQEIEHRAQVAMKAASELLSIAPQHDSRPRVMVYIGRGFDVDDGAVDETNASLKEAWRLDVRVIAVDLGAVRTARMPPPSSDAESLRVLKARRSSLEQLALPTRGFVLSHEQLSQAAARISEAVR